MKISKKIIAPVLTLGACLAVAVGSTYALFTSSAKTDVQISAGKVKVETAVEAIKAYSASTTKTTVSGDPIAGEFEIEASDPLWDISDQEAHRADYYYEKQSSVYSSSGYEGVYFKERGYVANKENDVVLQNMIPGDRATFDIKVSNLSNVDIKYKVNFGVNETKDYSHNPNGLSDAYKLYNALIKSEPETGIWYNWSTTGTPYFTLHFDFEMPILLTDEYQDLLCYLTFTVSAVQGNAYTIDDGCSNIPQSIKDANNELMVQQLIYPTQSLDMFTPTTRANLLAQTFSAGEYLAWCDEFNLYGIGKNDGSLKIYTNKGVRQGTTKQNVWYFAQNEAEATIIEASGYAIYYNYEATGTKTVANSCDLGSADLDKLEYVTNDTKSSVVKTNSNDVLFEVNAPNASVKHYGDAGVINVIACADHTYVEFGNGTILKVADGHIEIKKDSDIKSIHFTKIPNTEVFEDILVTLDEDVTLPELTRDSVKMAAGTEVKVCTIETVSNKEDIILTKQGVVEQIKLEKVDAEGTKTGDSRYASFGTVGSSDTQNEAANMLANDLEGMNRDAQGKIEEKSTTVETTTTTISFNETTRDFEITTKEGEGPAVPVTDPDEKEVIINLVVEDTGLTKEEIEEKENRVLYNTPVDPEEFKGANIGKVQIHTKDTKDYVCITESNKEEIAGRTILGGKIVFDAELNTLKLTDNVEISQIDFTTDSEGNPGHCILDLNGYVLTCDSWTALDVYKNGSYEGYYLTFNDSNSVAEHKGYVVNFDYGYSWYLAEDIIDARSDIKIITQYNIYGGIVMNENGYKYGSGVGDPYDGAILSTVGNSHITMNAVTFAGGRTDGDIGGICLNRSWGAFSELTMNNNAGVVGCCGASGGVEIYGGRFIMNDYSHISYCTAGNGGYYPGGAIAMYGGENAYFEMNDACRLDHCDSFEWYGKHMGGDSAAIHIANGGGVVLNGGTIEQCNGRTLFWMCDGPLTINGTKFVDCTLTGAFTCVQTSAATTINGNTTFSGCTCGWDELFDQNGQATYINGGDYTTVPDSYAMFGGDAGLVISGGTFKATKEDWVALKLAPDCAILDNGDGTITVI